jgi:hypothetical protein
MRAKILEPIILPREGYPLELDDPKMNALAPACNQKILPWKKSARVVPPLKADRLTDALTCSGPRMVGRRMKRELAAAG